MKRLTTLCAIMVMASSSAVAQYYSSPQYSPMGTVIQPSSAPTYVSQMPVSTVQYSQPASYGQPVQYSMPAVSTGYSTPVSSYATSGVPVTTASYSTPVTTPVTGMSSTQMPMYSNASYSSSMPVTTANFSQPVYSTPTYSTGSYAQPVTYSRPVYQSNYSAPTYSAPTYNTGYSSYGGGSGIAQQKAQMAANRGLRAQHLGGGFGGGKYEGVGFSTYSAQSAIQSCCYWGQRPVHQIGVARGADGWYATVIYR